MSNLRIEREGDENQWPIARTSALDARDEQDFPAWPQPLSTGNAASIATAATHRLQLSNASTDVAVLVRIRLGHVGGSKADSGMTDPGDNPVLTKTVPTSDGWYVVYCRVPMTYSGAGVWTPAAGSVFVGSVGAALPSATSGYLYVEIGQVRIVDAGIAGFIQTAKGDMAVSRVGNSTDYVDSIAQTAA